MPRRKGNAANKIAQNGLDARLELLIRNAEFKWDLVNGQEMYWEYKKAPSPVYCPPDSKDPNYQKWREKYYSLDNVDKRQKWKTRQNQLKFKYDHYLAKWDLNWGPWEYVETKGIDFPTLSPKKLSALFKRASSERAKWAERDREQGEPGPPTMFRLPVISWDPVERERWRLSNHTPKDLNPDDGEEYVMPEEVLDDLVPGQVGKKLTLELNLTFPRDVLEELVRLKLEQVFKRRKEPQKRQRLDKLEDQLKVFDLHEKKLTFPQIRTQFAKRPRLSTVKSAYVSIYRKINSINSSPSTSTETRFDPATHFITCSQCKMALDEKKFCQLAKNYINEDTKKTKLANPHEPDWERFDPSQRKQGHRRKGSNRSDDEFKEW